MRIRIRAIYDSSGRVGVLGLGGRGEVRVKDGVYRVGVQPL